MPDQLDPRVAQALGVEPDASPAEIATSMAALADLRPPRSEVTISFLVFLLRNSLQYIPRAGAFATAEFTHRAIYPLIHMYDADRERLQTIYDDLGISEIKLDPFERMMDAFIERLRTVPGAPEPVVSE